jgi:hypothetical protein
MTLTLMLLVVLVLLLIGVLPAYPHSRGWGYRPAASVGFAVIIVLGLHLLGVI